MLPIVEPVTTPSNARKTAKGGTLRAAAASASGSAKTRRFNSGPSNSIIRAFLKSITALDTVLAFAPRPYASAGACAKIQADIRAKVKNGAKFEFRIVSFGSHKWDTKIVSKNRAWQTTWARRQI